MIVLIAACVLAVLIATTVMFEIKDRRRRKRRRFVSVDPPGPRTIIVTRTDRPNSRAPWPPRD